MESDFKQYNPDIVGTDLRWKISKDKEWERSIHRSMMKLWFFPKHYSPISSTKDNLFYGLIPSYSPLYKFWQVHLWDKATFCDLWESRMLEWVQSYLNEFACDGNKLESCPNDLTLISQFSWLMVKVILQWTDVSDEYTLWRLFRHGWGWKITEHSQLEATVCNLTIKETIKKLEFLLSDLFEEAYSCTSIAEKSFPFVVPWFEFMFKNGHAQSIKIPGGYVDQKLLKKFWITRDCFIFWMNIGKFSAVIWKIEKREGNQCGWKNIPLGILPEWDILSSTRDIQLSGTWVILKPAKIALLCRPHLTRLLGTSSGNMSAEWNNDICVSAKWDILRISWDWRKKYYESLPRYLEHYYGWEILSETGEDLEIKFSSVDVEKLCRMLWWDWEPKSIHISPEEIIQILWVNFDLMSLGKEFQRLWYEISPSVHGYDLRFPAYKWKITNLRDILWEIIYYIYPALNLQDWWPAPMRGQLVLPNRNLYREVLFSIPQFLMANRFDEIDQKSLSLKGEFPDIDTIFWIKEYTIPWSNLVLKKSLTGWIIQHVVSHRSVLPYRWFSIEQLADGFHICLFIQCKSSEDELNGIYDFLHTTFWILERTFRLIINNDLPSVEKWKSFSIVDPDGNIVWYLGKLSKNKKVMGNMYIWEFIIKL